MASVPIYEQGFDKADVQSYADQVLAIGKDSCGEMHERLQGLVCDRISLFFRRENTRNYLLELCRSNNVDETKLRHLKCMPDFKFFDSFKVCEVHEKSCGKQYKDDNHEMYHKRS